MLRAFSVKILVEITSSPCSPSFFRKTKLCRKISIFKVNVDFSLQLFCTLFPTLFAGSSFKKFINRLQTFCQYLHRLPDRHSKSLSAASRPFVSIYAVCRIVIQKVYQPLPDLLSVFTPFSGSSFRKPASYLLRLPPSIGVLLTKLRSLRFPPPGGTGIRKQSDSCPVSLLHRGGGRRCGTARQYCIPFPPVSRRYCK